MPMNQLAEAFARHVAWTSAEPLGFRVDRASGPFIILDDGRSLIDLISGIAVSSIGHSHPEVIEAIERQLHRHLHVMVYGEFIQEPQVRFASLLASVLPEALQVVYFVNSGTEANEGALKLAKKYTGRSRMVAFEQSYHGDTHGSLSVTGRRVYQDPYRPLLPNVEFLPFDDIDALRLIDEETACVITEPIQGEGGVRVPSNEWMHALRRRCDETGALLIFDEVQTGFGRTGSLFAFEQFGIVPDILTLAKAMGGGLPVGAFISSASIMEHLRRDPPLSHVTTFGGHPLSCASGEAALQVILKEQLFARAREIETTVRTRLLHPLIREIRGRGAMLGMVLNSASQTEKAVKECLNRGVLLGWTLHSNTLVRIAPPLNIPWDVLHTALDQILASLDIAGDSD